MPVRKDHHDPSLHDATMKQGIVSILCSDFENTETTSIRTLSADMSSENWLQQNGFKSSSFSSQGEDDYQKMQKSDIWSSICSHKSELSSYVHPLVKRSSSCLSEKSLEFCTENLGSETGSDGFCSESQDEEDIEELNPRPPVRKTTVRSFPPPLFSIAGGNGPSLQMHSRRENGRLVLEAVSVPPRKNFHAQRRDGRLVLTFIISSDEVEEETSDGSGFAVARLVPPPPPLPPPPASVSLEYFWRSKTAVYGGFVDRTGRTTEHFAAYLKGCIGPKRSLLIWKPHCIATS